MDVGLRSLGLRGRFEGEVGGQVQFSFSFQEMPGSHMKFALQFMFECLISLAPVA